MTHTSSLRITRWTLLGDGDAYLLAFVAQGADFSRAVASIKLLDVWERAWLPEHKAWWIAGEAVTRLAVLLPELGDLLEQLGRAQRRHTSEHDEAGGTGGTHQRQRGERKQRTRKAPPHRGTTSLRAEPPAEVAQALALLCITADAPVELVAAARRVHARLHHPDRGGEGKTETMKSYNVAADRVESWLAQCASPVSASA